MSEASGTALAVANQRAMLPQEALFALDQRKAKMLASSPLIPKHLKGNSEQEAIANCYLALTMAREMKENPVVVMQNIYIVHGRAGWNAAYLIAKANSSGKFRGAINWRIEDRGKRKAKRKIKTGWDSAKKDPIYKEETIEVRDLCATAYATLKETGEEISFSVDMWMAEAENWLQNDKYLTMPELMLRYRSATLLVRLYAPEVMLGYKTDVELETMLPEDDSLATHLTRTAALESKLGLDAEAPKAEIVDDQGEIHEGPPAADDQPEPALSDFAGDEKQNAYSGAKGKK